VMMSVPYGERTSSSPLEALRAAGVTTFYWQYFQTPGVAEGEFEQDVERTTRTLLYGKGLSLTTNPGQGFLDGTSVPEQVPSWLTEEDIAYYVNTYKATGFRGGLNWYRNLDRNWELSAAWEGMKIRQPALFIAGTQDGVIKGFAAKALEQLPTTVPGLRSTRLISGAGHWVQQERATEVNSAIVDFLRTA
jgi:pimeloyl-ACP methyl ester carboxylesterase